ASPALSVSSNRLKNPDTIQRKDLQAWLLASYEHPLSEKMHLLLGLCADHRFGHYRAYPLAGILWKPGKKWRFRLAYPDAGIAYRPFPKLKLSFSAGPDGNEWRVYDKSMDRNSAFQYESVRLETGISWSISKAFSLGITAGKQFNNRFRLTMENNRRIATATGTISFVSMQLNLVF
ncbi:MAG: hypothetical protein GY862_07420, partial [Gammaproteobacteria bacterium]|nr:hypothetical protein [Gammaproteobacteria bacterium]